MMSLLLEIIPSAVALARQVLPHGNPEDHMGYVMQALEMGWDTFQEHGKIPAWLTADKDLVLDLVERLVEQAMGAIAATGAVKGAQALAAKPAAAGAQVQGPGSPLPRK